MTRPLQFIPFKSRADKGWPEAWELYEKSFPYNERWSEEAYDRAFRRPEFRSRRHLARRRVHRHPLPLGCRRVPVMSSTWPSHPPCGEQKRGSAALSAFCRKVGRVILEIDPPVDDISIRRLHFYERLGSSPTPTNTSTRRSASPSPHRLVLMSYPGAITYEEARSFADFVGQAVLRYSEHEAPTLPNLA